MDLYLKGKSVIVTAASKGLGKAIATEFAKEGAHVLIGSRSESGLKEAVADIKRVTDNPQVDFAICDMTDAQQINELVEKAVAWNGTVDALVNNAGGPPAGRFIDMSDDDWYHAFELNLLSFIRMMRQVIPLMQKQQTGHIVNLASSSIKQPINHLVLSNTMRPGIAGLAKTLSQELGEDNILINTVGPGTIATDRIHELNEIRADQQGMSLETFTKQAESKVPLQRYGQPSEFAKAVVFLASGANTYITGQSLLVDGGLIKAL